MKLIGREDLAEHPEYATPEARLSHLDDCFGIIQAWTQKHTKFEVMKMLNQIKVPCGPIFSMKDIIEDQSLAARESVVEVEHPKRGIFKTVGCPIKLSDSPVEVKTSPLLGEHTEEILKELVGYGDEHIEAATAEGAI
jgi:formyl-CoA transferase